jgi:hypothetical protein
VYTRAASATPAPFEGSPIEGYPNYTVPLALLTAWVSLTFSRAMADQTWFWTPEWQEGEREVDEHIAAGRTTYFDSVDEFLAALDRETS